MAPLSFARFASCAGQRYFAKARTAKAEATTGMFAGMCSAYAVLTPRDCGQLILFVDDAEKTQP